MAERPDDRERAPERTTRATKRSSTAVIAITVGLILAVVVLFWLFGGPIDVGDAPEVAETGVVEEAETASGEPQEEMVGAGAEGEEEVIPEIDVEAAGDPGTLEEPGDEERQPAD